MVDMHQKTIVGVFALAGLILTGIMVVMFGGGGTLFASTYDVSVRFPHGVVGVQEGQSVTLNGKRIGQTKAVEFWNPGNLQEGVRVIMAVDEEFELPATSRVEISTSLMGFGRPAILVIVEDPDDPGKLPRDGNATMQGMMIPMLDQVLTPDMQRTLGETAAHLGELAAALKPVAANLETILESRNVAQVDNAETTANVTTLIERLDIAVKNFDGLIGDPESQTNFKQMIANTRTVSEHAVRVAENANTLVLDFQKVAGDTGRLVRNLANSVDEASAVLNQLEQTFAALNNQEGTVGLLLNDKRLYEELLLSAKRLTKMLDEAREVMDIVKKGELQLKLKTGPF